MSVQVQGISLRLQSKTHQLDWHGVSLVKEQQNFQPRYDSDCSQSGVQQLVLPVTEPSCSLLTSQNLQNTSSPVAKEMMRHDMATWFTGIKPTSENPTKLYLECNRRARSQEVPSAGHVAVLQRTCPPLKGCQ